MTKAICSYTILDIFNNEMTDMNSKKNSPAEQAHSETGKHLANKNTGFLGTQRSHSKAKT